MGIEWVSQTLEALQQAGIRAQRGFPAGKMPYLTGLVAGVSLEQAQSDSTTVTVQIYGPMAMGGPACEDMAAQAAQALTRLGASCSIGSCAFDSKAGIFCLPVQVRFAHAVFASDAAVYIDGTQVENLVSVSTRYKGVRVKTKDPGGTTTVTIERYWRVQLEDLLPSGAIDQGEDGFSLMIQRAEGNASYTQCRWESIHTDPVEGGLRRVRVAVTNRQPTVTAAS